MLAVSFSSVILVSIYQEFQKKVAYQNQMKVFIESTVVVFFFLGLSVSGVQAADGFVWKSCESDLPETVTFATLEMLTPIKLDANISVKIKVHSNEEIIQGTKLALKFYRIVSVFGERRVLIPCVKGAGSCTQDLCGFVSPANPFLDVCSHWPNDIGPCGCPIKGNVTIDNTFNLLLPKLPSIGSFLAKGKYEAKIELRNANDKSIFCMEVVAHLEG